MSIQRRIIGIIGAGHVGSHVAFSAAAEGLADDIILYDVNKEKSEAQAMDIQDSIRLLRAEVQVYAGTAADMTHADVIVMAAGSPRTVGQNRLDKMESSVGLCKNIMPQIIKSRFDGIIISITNPCDVIAAYIQKVWNWPVRKIIGSGTVLDSIRLQNDIAMQMGTARHSVTAYVLGEHGDSSIIPWSHVFVGNQSVGEWEEREPGRFPEEWQNILLEKVHRRASAEVRGKGSTEFGIACSVCEIMRSIFHNEHKILPCSVSLNGIYGIQKGFASIPVQLGAGGAEKICPIPMTGEEREAFCRSVNIVQTYLSRGLLL